MSVTTIDGRGGVVITGDTFLELPKTPLAAATGAIREGMIRYNKSSSLFEGALKYQDGSCGYNAFAQLDKNGQLIFEQLPDSVTSGIKYAGTFNPVVDDVDPPSSDNNNKLPVPDIDKTGNYFIVSGIYDTALNWHRLNVPTTSPVTFDTTFGRIKYYFADNPFYPGSVQITNAFYAINSDIAPIAHPGMVYLVTKDPTLTVFSSTNLPENETALTDGEWILYSALTISRAKQSRITTMAASVRYDKNFMAQSGRPMSDDTATVQGFLDDITLNTVRRSGDSMYDNGDPLSAGGRLAFVYGDKTRPAITFNASQFDPFTNVGVDPVVWTDGSTGLYRPSQGVIGFASLGNEVLLVSTAGVNVVKNSVTDNTPVINISNDSDVRMGIGTYNGELSFYEVNNKIFSVSSSSARFYSSLTVDGNLSIGGTLGLSSLQVSGNTVFGTSATDNLTVQSTSTFSETINTRMGFKINPIVTDDYFEISLVNNDVDDSIRVNFDIANNGNEKFVFRHIISAADVGYTDGTFELFTLDSTLFDIKVPVIFNALSTFKNKIVSNGIKLTDGTNDDYLDVYTQTILDGTDDKTIIVFEYGDNGDESIVFKHNITSPVTGAVIGTTDVFSIGRTGVTLPSVPTVVPTDGVDGTIAYESDSKRLIAKRNNTWNHISAVEYVDFVIADWVLDEPNLQYVYTMPIVDVISVDIYKNTAGVYKKVGVDVVYDATQIIVKVASDTDLRFDGRLVVTLK